MWGELWHFCGLSVFEIQWLCNDLPQDKAKLAVGMIFVEVIANRSVVALIFTELRSEESTRLERGCSDRKADASSSYKQTQISPLVRPDVT
jgi:hypothetical protein